MAKKQPSITIAIPAYNEEECIGIVIKDTLKKLPKYFRNYEIIVVDDGSTDKTNQIVKRYAKINSRLKIIEQENRGFSRALETAIHASTKEFVAYMPADGQFLTEDMRHCFGELKNADLVLGYRGGRSDYSWQRIFYSYGYLLLLLVLFDIKYMDVGWVNIWRTKNASELKLKALGGIFILTELVVRFKKLGYRIVEAPSYYRPRIGGEVKNAKIKVVLSTFVNACKLWAEMKFS